MKKTIAFLCFLCSINWLSAQTDKSQRLRDSLKSDLKEVVVVGSRSKDARSRLSTPVPVDVVRTKDIKPFAQADVSQMLTYTVPSFQSARQTISDGTDHVDPAGLRGLGPDQTLVLLNGKRLHTTALVNINGTVGRGSVGTDLNTIPAAAIERIEVLRDGASAQYGSDAIAGVINIVLKKNYNGFNISSMVGQNFTNMPYSPTSATGKNGVHIEDGVNQQIDFNGGFAKANGAYLNVTGQFLRRFGTNRSGDDNIPLIYLGNAGAFPANPYTAQGISDADYRRYVMDKDAEIVKSRGYNRHNVIEGNSYSLGYTGFVNAGAPLSRNIDFYLTAGASHRDGDATGNSRNPNSVNQQPVVANGSRFYPDGFLPHISPTITDYTALAGITIKAGQWNIDLSNMLGRNALNYAVNNSGNASFPASDDVQTHFDAGKLAFLQNTINLDFSRKFHLSGNQSLNLAFGGEHRYEDFRITAGEPNSYNNKQRLASIDSIAPYPGTTRYTTFAPVATASGAQVFPGFKDVDAIHATRNIYAAYTDLEFSLGKLLLDVAARYEDYAEKGFSYDNLSGKLSARYDITSQFAVRGSISNGFRAPSLHQRYFQNTSTQFIGGQPLSSLTANNLNPIVRDAFGIKELKPEKSTSYTLGFVGKLTEGLSVTVDAYFISIKDRIVLSTAFNRTNPLVDSILKKNNVDPLTSALQFWTNAVNTETKGIDIVATDRFILGKGTATISLAANFNKNSVVGNLHTNSIIDDPKLNPSLNNPSANPANDLALTLFDRQQRGRIETANPRNKINLTLNYALPRWNFLVRSVRFGQVQLLNNIDPTLVNKTTGAYFNDVALGADQTFSAKITTDLVVSYKPYSGISITAGANNIFDVYPDRIFVDPRNDLQAVHNNPVAGANKAPGGYGAARDQSNRGRLLFGPNQFGYNGRFLFTRLTIEFGELYGSKKLHKK
ncbi:MAG: TonB-dependent receptor [Bacteroidetes bacterium]|nr:TonB-dependent receptor [Bacteroidota bacterium]